MHHVTLLGLNRMHHPLDSALEAKLSRLCEAGDSYLVAVSGGRDSMVLLHWLIHCGFTNLTVLHFNHLLRSEASNADCEFVEDHSRKLGLEFEAGEGDVKAFAAEHRISIETAAREMRYAWMASVAKRRSCNRLFLAHHADDQVETVLINLFRGSGARGISGMDEVSNRIIDGTAMKLIRPLLTVPRSEIDRYTSEQQIPFREDASNGENTALRNRVRNKLIPFISECFERDVSEAVLRAADLARLDETLIGDLAPAPVEKENGLDVASLRMISEALRNRQLLRWLSESGVPNCGQREVHRASEVALSADKPAKANLPGGFHIRRKRGVLFIQPPGQA